MLRKLFRLIVWIHLQRLYRVCDGQLLMVGNADSKFTGMVRVINSSVTWLNAHSACLNMGYGSLMHSRSTGDRVVYTRKLLIENGWPDMPLWIGYVKDSSANKWNRITTNCSVLTHGDVYQFDNDLPNTQLCALVNMTSNTGEPAWFGAPCDQRHAFICEETTVPMTVKTKDASLIPALLSSQLTTTYDCSATCCRNKILSQMNIPAVQVNVANGSCVELRDDIFRFPLPYYVNMSATGSDVIAVTTEMTAVILNDNSTINYTLNTDLSCFTILTTATAVTIPETSTLRSNTDVEGSSASPQLTTAPTSHTSSAENVTRSSLYFGECVHYNSTSADNITKCRRICRANKDIITDALLQRWLNSILEDLTLNRKLLSSYIRNHVSADDNRFTSKALGLCGVCLILTFFSVIILSDVINLGQGKYSFNKQRSSMSRYTVTKSKKQKSTARRRVH